MAFDKREILQLSIEEKRQLAFELLDSIVEKFAKQTLPDRKKTDTGKN